MGKIVTPESIMDKSTKLEYITDRIEIIKLRFALLVRTLQLLKAEMGEQYVLDVIQEWFNPSFAADFSGFMDYLQGELQFLEKVNIGGEFLPDADMERIRQIANIRLNHDNHFLFLLSETDLENLLIRRGTLTFEEKNKMDEHASITWEMLSQLSFPKKYKNVAEYAASHHEKLNGKGYPRGLKAEELPLQARIIAIADIFEALTAADRPYKKAKTLSESMKILAFCVKDGDLDADVLDFFLDSGLYLEFAKGYMHEEQIDTIDVPALKKIYRPEAT